jgi:hypothetical protein
VNTLLLAIQELSSPGALDNDAAADCCETTLSRAMAGMTERHDANVHTSAFFRNFVM